MSPTARPEQVRTRPAADPREILDDLDRRIVVALQRNGRASWTEIASVTGASVTTVARRGQYLLGTGMLRIAATPSLSLWGPVDQFVVRLRCEAGQQTKVARALSARGDVRFLSMVTGAHDLVAELIVPKGATSLHAVLTDEIHTVPGVVSSEADLVLHTYKAASDWSRHLLDDDLAWSAAPPDGSPDHDAARPDDVDRGILAQLRDDGRLSFKAVAQHLSVNESTVRRRFEAMVSEGWVVVVTLVPAAALGFETEVLLWLDTAPGRTNAVAHALEENPRVRYVAATLGRSSLLCELIMPTTDDLFRFTTEVLPAIDGVRSWEASIELLTVKRGFVDCPWAMPWMSPR